MKKWKKKEYGERIYHHNIESLDNMKDFIVISDDLTDYFIIWKARIKMQWNDELWMTKWMLISWQALKSMTSKILSLYVEE